MMLPLYSALAGKPKTLEWCELMVAAFQDTKAALSRAIMFMHPCPNTPTSLTVDASEQAVDAIPQQLLNGIWQYLVFFSFKKMHPPEKKYSAFDWELLALYLGVIHFRYFSRAENSLHIQTTNLSLSPWPKYQIHCLVNSSNTTPTSLNLPPIFSISRL